MPDRQDKFYVPGAIEIIERDVGGSPARDDRLPQLIFHRSTDMGWRLAPMPAKASRDR